MCAPYTRKVLHFKFDRAYQKIMASMPLMHFCGNLRFYTLHSVDWSIRIAARSGCEPSSRTTHIHFGGFSMSSIAFDAAGRERTMTEQDQRTWRISAISLMSVRVIQGFIYWGGGSGRFIYAPGKLNPHAAH
jgi:hypothetical protein